MHQGPHSMRKASDSQGSGGTDPERGHTRPTLTGKHHARFLYTSWSFGLHVADGETVADFIFLGSKITADGDCSLEIKRRLLLGRKVRTNLDGILKSRDVTLPTKVRLCFSICYLGWS